MAITVPNLSLIPFIIMIMLCTSLASPFISGWIQIPSQVQIEAEIGDGQLQTFNITLQAVTISNSYLWGIDDRPNNTFPPGNLVMCKHPCTDGKWIDGYGTLDQIDADSREVWGTSPSVYRQLYRKPVHISNTEHFTRVRSFKYDWCDCSCDVTVSENGYVWVLSCENTYIFDGSNWMTIPHEMSLTQIEAGDEEVWAVNATNHIFKRPVDGSGEWSIVPGEMRYISASGNAHVWGLAPNDSLYVCEKPCTGDWLYVGGCFKQVDGGNNAVIGVTTNNSILFMSLEGKSIRHVHAL